MADDPHYQAFGVCCSCGRTFGFNPHRVPSIPIHPDTGANVPTSEGGVRQPICRDCAERANRVREQQGLPLWDTSDAAYAPVRELDE